MPNESKSDPKEERRREILMAALAAFSEKGYDKTTVEDIVRASGLSKGTLYWYFTNKEAIFTALVGMVFDEMWALFAMLIESTKDQPPAERLRQLLVGFSATIDESVNWIGLYADFFNQAWQNGSVKEVFQTLYIRYTDAAEALVKEGIAAGAFRPVDANLAARMLVGAVDGFWFQQILDIGEAQPVLELYADTIVRGLMKDNANDR